MVCLIYMSKFFSKSKEWAEGDQNFVGLPRPFAIFDQSISSKLRGKTPIPWQSIPNLEFKNLKLNLENEKKIYNENLCPYCGIKIKNEEIVVRWITTLDAAIYSDFHPFHIPCMKEARKFCPFMKTTKNEEFEYGMYFKLKKHAINYKNNHKSTNPTLTGVDH